MTTAHPMTLSPMGRRLPQRLTGRGRAVVASLIGLGFLLGVLGLALPGGGQPADSVSASSAQATESLVDLGAVLAAQGLANEHVVVPGDTLWDLAVAIDPVGDPRLVVEYIREINGLGAAELQVGQRLWLPLSVD